MSNVTGCVTDYTAGTGNGGFAARYDEERKLEDGPREATAAATAAAERSGRPSGGSLRQYNAYGERQNGSGSESAFAFGFATQFKDHETGDIRKSCGSGLSFGG